MKKIILLNPPFEKYILSRDYFCCQTSKSNYCTYPIDLLVLSGILAEKHEVVVIDAVVEKLSFAACFEKIKTLQADGILFLSGGASWKSDFDFLESVKKQNPSIFLIGLGDIFFDETVFRAAHWLDAVLLDFTSHDILKYLDRQYDSVRNMMWRSGGDINVRKLVPYHGELFEIPVPKHRLFLEKAYTFPFARDHRYMTVLSDFGCAFNCPFCFHGTLGHKERSIENVMDELASLYCNGIRELFFQDQTFGYHMQRAMNLCSKIIERKWKLSWTAFTRANVVNKDLLDIMKKAGCHTLIIGVESASENILSQYKPGVSKDCIKKAFSLCRAMGIRTVGTFMLGFPGENKNDMKNTIDFACTLECDFASFNIFSPKSNTVPWHEHYKKAGITPVSDEWDQAGQVNLHSTDVVTASELRDLLSLAVRQFYFNPKRIVRQIMTIRSWHDCRMFFQNGAGLIRNIVSTGWE